MSKGFLRRLMWTFAAVLVFAGAAFARPGGLVSDFDMGRDSFARNEAVTVRWSLQNEGLDAVGVLRWRTPLQGFDADLFEVRVHGHEVAYLGRVVKYGPPAADDFVRIPAGGAITAIIDLASVYDMSEAGVYTVRYRGDLLDFQGVRVSKNAAAPGPVRTYESAIQIEDRGEPRHRNEVDFDSVFNEAKAPGYVACSGSQQNLLSTALGNAETASGESLTWLNGHVGDSRYTTWFGAYDSGRYGTVTNHFTAIKSAFTNQTVTFHCDCTSSAYAYVYPTQPYNIWLCNAFWNAPAKGTDSKAGTLVHEMSHFNATAGTNDYAYGQTACKKLAQKKPRSAINNADSHEYYAEAGM